MPRGSVVDISKVKPGHKHFLARHDREFDNLLNEQRLTREARAHISANAAFKNRTGNLVNSTQVRVIRSGGNRIIRFTNKAKYAAAQDSGSGLYGPNRSKYMIAGNPFLVFMWKGVKVAFRYVMHPGVKPTHFLEVARGVSFRTHAALLRAAMRRSAKSF